MRPKKLVYICDGISPAVISQVVELLKVFSERKYFEEVILLLGLKDFANIEKINKLFKDSAFLIYFFKTYPNYSFYNFISKFQLEFLLRKNNLLNKEFVFHIRGERMSSLLYKILKYNYNEYNIITDIRGVSIEETKEFYRGNFIFKYLKILTYKNYYRHLKENNKISTVTKYLKDYLVKNHNLDSKKIIITPCLASDKFVYNNKVRMRKRSELQLLKNEILFVFSTGGNQDWQNFDTVNRIAEKGYKILNLSKKNIKHSNVINKFVSYNEMPEYLCAADFAIIFRERKMTSNVACPIKFCEYVCCGLPVIANDSVFMINDFINKYKSGIIIESLDFLNEKIISDLLRLDRNYISKIARENFSVNKIIENYWKFYNSDIL